MACAIFFRDMIARNLITVEMMFHQIRITKKKAECQLYIGLQLTIYGAVSSS